MYHHKSVVEKTSYGKKVIKGLFFKIRKNPKKLNYFYILTPKGLAEKTKLTLNLFALMIHKFQKLMIFRKDRYVKLLKQNRLHRLQN